MIRWWRRHQQRSRLRVLLPMREEELLLWSRAASEYQRAAFLASVQWLDGEIADARRLLRELEKT